MIADIAAQSGAEYSPLRDPAKPVRGSALMCAQVINLAIGESCCAFHGASVCPYEDYSAPLCAGRLRQP